jgi:hypothetical protein
MRGLLGAHSGMRVQRECHTQREFKRVNGQATTMPVYQDRIGRVRVLRLNDCGTTVEDEKARRHLRRRKLVPGRDQKGQLGYSVFLITVISLGSPLRLSVVPRKHM